MQELVNGKLRVCRLLSECPPTERHAEVLSLERSLLSRVSEHHECKRAHLIDTNSTSPLYFGKKGKKSFYRGPEGGPPGERWGDRARGPSHRSKGSSQSHDQLRNVRPRSTGSGLRSPPGASTARVPAILSGVPGSGGVKGLEGGQGAGGHGTAGAQNPAPLGAGAEGGDGESGSRGTVWHKSQGQGRSGTPRTPTWACGAGRGGGGLGMAEPRGWDGAGSGTQRAAHGAGACRGVRLGVRCPRPCAC